jgi:hypothetical protein
MPAVQGQTNPPPTNVVVLVKHGPFDHCLPSLNIDKQLIYRPEATQLPQELDRLSAMTAARDHLELVLE